MKMPKAGRKVPSASSVVNKFINAAVERHQRTSKLSKPILEQRKRTNSVSSH